MNDELKEKVAANAWLIAIVVGVIVFAIAYNVVRGTGRDWPLSLGVAVVFFLVAAIASWLVASNVVDAYTLDAADNIGDVNRLLDQIHTAALQIVEPAISTKLNKICKDTVSLVMYTRKRQPDNLLSCATVLEEWLKIVLATAQDCVDVGAHSEYYKNPQAKYASALKGFEGFDQFLINSIQMIADGHNVSFENNAKMLDATRHNLV